MGIVGRTVAAPLLFLNFVLYIIVLGFASWCVNRFACKEITLKGHRGWRLKVVEALIIILTLTELLYLLLIHAGMMSSRYGPGYRDNRDTGYGTGGHGTDPAGHTGHKGTGIPESRV
ncbi:hypothetical protein RHGRI_003710 [Rhododendron griersonianum]|uniref:Uncharacterized protein n=1 Tax=Rhododendron griersonianum TaxID=479676 RepID=A0AAV6L5Z6_9ERIC|nr:hypothetical protein RHGRI_003710 [Rhododendron griersonianum]